MTMNLRKNIGIIMMMLGVILTINHEQQNEFIQQLETSIKAYWPLILIVLFTLIVLNIIDWK